MNVAISTIAYDSFEYPEILDSIKGLGVDKVEIAMIAGTSANFSEKLFDNSVAEEIRQELEKRKMECVSLACHTDLSQENANELLTRRIAFAKSVGAKKIITYATSFEDFPLFQKRAQEALKEAQKQNIQILIENPSDGRRHILNSSKDIPRYLELIDPAVFGINYDPGNFVSHRPQEDVLQDALNAVGKVNHMHVKDVQKRDGNYYFCTIGSGVCAYEQLLAKVFQHDPTFPITIEFPLAVYKGSKGESCRHAKLPSLLEIEEALRTSLEFMQDVWGRAVL